jgi:hypothetical protein
MYRWVVGGLSLLMFAGCASKQEKELMQMYEAKKLYHKALLKTEKALFKNPAGTTDLTVVATYLNTDHLEKRTLSEEDKNIIASFFGIFEPSNKQAEQKEPERFIVGFYSDVIDTDYLQQNGISMRLQGKKPVFVRRIPRNDKRLKRLSFITDWGSYYLVSFPHAKSGRMNLTVSYGENNATLPFSKRAKYVYTKRAFD